MNNGVKISKEDRDNLVKSYPLLRTKNRVIKNENKEGCSPLFLSALAGNGCDALAVDKINLLLDAGADPRRQSEITGFHFLTLLAQIQPEFYGKGSEAKYRRLLRRLVDMGVDHRLVDGTGMCAADFQENAGFVSALLFVSAPELQARRKSEAPARL